MDVGKELMGQISVNKARTGPRTKMRFQQRIHCASSAREEHGERGTIKRWRQRTIGRTGNIKTRRKDLRGEGVVVWRARIVAGVAERWRQKEDVKDGQTGESVIRGGYTRTANDLGDPRMFLALDIPRRPRAPSPVNI